jgi:NAD(P)H-dependent nitrite reductase small subunit
MTLLDHGSPVASAVAASTAPSGADAASSAWTTVCRRDQLEPLWGEAALIGTDQVALFLMPDGRLFAVNNADPATGAFVMSRGIVGSKGDRPTIASPLHKDVFDLATGSCYTKTALHLPTWRVREHNGEVQVSHTAALIAASHGTSDPAGRRAVAALVDVVRHTRPDLTVLDSFVDVQEPDVPTTMATLNARTPATIVPLLLSAGYHVHVDLADAARDAAPREVRVTGALGPDIRLATVLARRLAEAGLRDDDRVVLAAAGSSNDSAVADCHTVGAMLADQLGRDVTVSFISAAEPRVADAVTSERAIHPGARVVVATYLLAPGYFATLASQAGADVTSRPLLVDPLLPDPLSDDPLLVAAAVPPPELVAIVTELYTAASR